MQLETSRGAARAAPSPGGSRLVRGPQHDRSGRASIVSADWVASLCCCKFAAPRFPVALSLSRGHLLVGRSFASGVSHPAQALAFELAEADAVLGVGDVEVKHGPDEREAAGLAGEAADHLGAAFDLGERPF